MTGKFDLLWIGTRNRVHNFVEDFKSEETGAAEIVAIILIIVAVIAAAAIFQDKIKELVTHVFEGIDTNTGKATGSY